MLPTLTFPSTEMASQASQILASPHNVISSNMENRPKADFHPSIWGDVFLNCPDKVYIKLFYLFLT